MRLYSDHVLVDTEDGPQITAARIDTAGARIASVQLGSREDLVTRGVVDFGSRLIAPAWVNGHTHIAMSAYRGIGGRAAQAGNVVEELYFRLESFAEPDDILAFARMGAWEVALSGTGAIVDQYYAGEMIAQALLDIGLSGIVAPTLQDINGPGMKDWSAALDTTEQLATDPRYAAAGIFPALGPHATDTVSINLWGRALTLAERHNLPVHVHVGQSLEEVERSFERYQCTPVQRLARMGALDSKASLYLVHMLYVSEADLRSLDASRHTLGYCPRSQVQFAYPAHLGSWREAGLPFLVGTDAGVCNDTMNVQQELRWLAGAGIYSVPFSSEHRTFRERGDLFSARHVERVRRDQFAADAPLNEPLNLMAAAGRTARRLHPQLDVGRIGAGAVANLCVYDLDHPALWPATDPLRALTHGDPGPALHAMVLGGNWFGTPGYLVPSLTSSDRFQAHRDEATRRLQLLLQRAGL